MKRTFIAFGMVLQAVLNERHGQDGLRAVTTSPVSVRTHFDIRVLEKRTKSKTSKKSYKKRKNLSDVVIQKYMSPADYRAAKTQFKKGDGINHVDPFEAALIALYLDAKRVPVIKAADRPTKFIKLSTKKKTATPQPLRSASVTMTATR